MKNAVLTAISLTLVIAVLGIGGYALLTPQDFSRNKVSFVLSNDNLNLTIEGNVDWVDENVLDKTFFSESGPNGLSKDCWNVPDIEFSVEEGNEIVIATMSIKVENFNDKDGVKLYLSGIAFDSDLRFENNPRFISRINFYDDIPDVEPDVEEVITDTNKSFTRTIPRAENSETPKTLEIVISFELSQCNFDIDFYNNIEITFESESVSG